MEQNSEMKAPLLEEFRAEEVESPSEPSIRRTSSEYSGDERLRLRQLSGRWQFKLQSNLGKWMDSFDETEGVSSARQDYNRRQKATLQAYKEVHDLRFSGSAAPAPTNDKEEAQEDFAVNTSNIANILLLILKIYASVRTESLSIIASTLDSLLDLLAGAILWFTKYSMKRHDVYEFPIGKSRVQPVGIVIFAAVMATLGVQVLIEAVRQLLEHGESSQMSTSQLVWLCSIMGLAIISKFFLFLYCRSFKNEILKAYSQDHSFDVLTNIVGLAAALLANWFYWWIDPIGAIILAVYTIVVWSKTVFENAVSLVGKGAPPEVIQKLTYLALSHSSKIQHIDTVRAYTFGSSYFVEVDIELPENMPLKEAHDIGESLQDRIELLPEVERAFVHLDHECTHKPEHSSQI